MRFYLFALLFVFCSCSSELDGDWLSEQPTNSDVINLHSGVEGVVGSQTRGNGTISGTLTTDLPVTFVRLDKPLKGSYPDDYTDIDTLSAIIVSANNRISFDKTQHYLSDGGDTKFIGWYPAGTWKASDHTVTFPVLDGTTDILASTTSEANKTTGNQFTEKERIVRFSHVLTQVRVLPYLADEAYKAYWGNLTGIAFTGKAQVCTLKLPATTDKAGTAPTVSFAASKTALPLQKLDNTGKIEAMELSTEIPKKKVEKEKTETEEGEEVEGSEEDEEDIPVGYAMFAPHKTEKDTLYVQVTTVKGGTQELAIPYESMKLESGKIYDLYLEFGATTINAYATIANWQPDGTMTYGTSSNCYILKPGGNTIAIPVSRANEYIRQLGETEAFTASILWNDGDAKMISLSKATGKGYKDYIHVTSGAKDLVGNAVVTLNRATGDKEVLWSWHIWVTDYDPNAEGATWTNTQSNNSRTTFMDRNLGATENSLTTTSRGLFYQWGRKDPFPRTDIAGFSKASAGAGVSIATTIINPGVFYCISTSPYDWHETRNSYLWVTTNDKKTIYDPCPVGWRVPTTSSSESGTMSPWYGLAAQSYSGSAAGMSWGTNCYWPAAGYMNCTTGSVTDDGYRGYYWSATPYDTESGTGFNFYSNYIHTNRSGFRGGAFPVRCVKDN